MACDVFRNSILFGVFLSHFVTFPCHRRGKRTYGGGWAGGGSGVCVCPSGLLLCVVNVRLYRQVREYSSSSRYSSCMHFIRLLHLILLHIISKIHTLHAIHALHTPHTLSTLYTLHALHIIHTLPHASHTSYNPCGRAAARTARSRYLVVTWCVDYET